MAITQICACGSTLEISDSVGTDAIECPQCGQVIKLSDSPTLPPNDQTYQRSSGLPKATLYALLGLLLIGAIVLVSVLTDPGGEKAERLAEQKLGPLGPEVESIGGEPQANAEPLTEEECLAVTTKFCEHLEAGDPMAAKGLISYRDIAKRSTFGIEAPEEFRQGFVQGVMNQAPRATIESKLAGETNSTSSFRVLRAHRVGEELRIWVRNATDEGMNYTDLVFGRDTDGKPRVVDVYSVYSGELFSQTMRRLYIMAVASSNRNLIQRMSQSDSDFVKYSDEFRDMGQLAMTEPARALEIYNSLPKSIQQNKAVMLIRVSAAGQLGDDKAYMAALTKYRELFPGDPSIDMLAIDWHVLREEYAEAIQAIDNLDDVVGGDPFLDSHRANILTEQGEYDEAIKVANRCIDADPTMQDGHWSLLSAHLRKGDYAMVLIELKRLDKQFVLDWGDLRDIPEYEPFTESPEHEGWLSYLESKPAPPELIRAK